MLLLPIMELGSYETGPPQIDRRQALDLLWRAAAGGLALALVSCGSDNRAAQTANEAAPVTEAALNDHGAPEHQEPSPLQVGGYLPRWLANEAYAALDPGILAVDRLNLCFAFPEYDGSIAPLDMPPNMLRYAAGTGRNAEINLAVGGYSDDTGTQQGMLNRWGSALASGKVPWSLDQAADTLEQHLQRPVGVIFDMEYPRSDQRVTVNDTLQTFRQLHPDRSLYVSVPVGIGQAGFDIPRLASIATGLEVMAFDYSGPWSPVAEATAPVDSVLHDVSDIIVQAGGDASKVHVGFTAYARQFVGARALGDQFDKQASYAADTVPLNQVRQQDIIGEGEALINGNWSSFTSPEQVKAALSALRRGHPYLAGSWSWTIDQSTPDFMRALRG